MADKINKFGWRSRFTCQNRDVREGMKYGKLVMPAVPTVAVITFTDFVGKDSSMLQECSTYDQIGALRLFSAFSCILFHLYTCLVPAIAASWVCGLQIFQQKGHSVNFLDVTLETDGSYKPYRKPNGITKYVNKASNHPPSILKNIPASIQRRLNSMSSSEDMFGGAKDEYEKALKDAGYTETLQYDSGVTRGCRPKRKRSRRIIWPTLQQKRRHQHWQGVF